MVIRKKFKVEMAHRVLRAYTERCKGVHGHSYGIEVFIFGTTQNEAQMLLDFKEVKDIIGSFIDAFDHSIIIWDVDRTLVDIAHLLNDRYIIVPYNPTAEQMSRHIYKQCSKLGLNVKKIIVQETDSGFAEFSGDDEININLKEVIYSDAIQYK